ncbi:hypothetical protein [Chryseobacterium daecheongense]|uniref:DUF4136 domain-containing protein n=1 Tax=Chryseobacterium daecheongense TaxID=192389 RepID=A0A3N0W409_9FLAO|nr:hypothetical protein [Chryseobacterium daecheongense]ROH99799.1 hypothetical protein EGI05_02625 [Chryseobacterium daecheongense]TDX95271.1 hypothetical protein BCF50_1048 [Chryseobacterium daecheongense]UOU97486.1 hypothetical protein MUU74_13400 [Chryseobacterium daecheongense]
MKKIQYILFIFFIVFINSCSSTQIVNSWRDPDKHIHAGDWKKVLVVALLRNETNRRRTEDEMVKYLHGKGVTSYSYLGEKFNRNDEEALRSKIKNDGFDAAITMRLIDVDKEKIFVPEQHYMYPMYYSDFSRYYFRNWMYYTTPGYYTVTKKFIIETVIYSIQDDKIIWSGITETYDPEGVKRLTNEIAHAIRKKMLQEGFIEE